MDKKTLQQYIYLNKEIKKLIEDKEELMDSIGSVKPSDGMPHGTGTGDQVGNLICRMDNLEQKINLKIDQMIALRERIEDVIGGLEPKDSLLMRLRYIDGKRWEQVAVEMNYSYSDVLRKHGYILNRIRER